MQTNAKPQKRYPTEAVIDALAQAHGRELPGDQARLYRHALQSLVQLAKDELMLEMRLEHKRNGALKN
jgi:hypothetical protein